MTTEEPKKPMVSDSIIDAIKSGGVKMRPRWYFVASNVLAGVAIIIILLIAVYLASFIIFVLHEDGAWFVPVFGLAGWYSLFNALPWVLILLSAGFIVLLAWLGWRYSSRSYQWPLFYSLLGIFFLVSATSFLFVKTSFSEQLFDDPLFVGIPLLNSYYPGIGPFAPNDIHRGTIIQIIPGGVLIQGEFGVTSTILIDKKTSFPVSSSLNLNDLIVVFGNRSSTGTILAAGIEKVGQ
jgi:hypothetical protein